MRVLSVASEIFPLVKTGGLADVAGALPGALAREGVAVRTLVPGYPAVLGASEGVGGRCTVTITCSAARPGCCREPPAVSTFSCSMRRISTSAPADSYGDAGRPGLARQRAALRGAGLGGGRDRTRAGSGLRAGRRACPRLAGGLAPAYLALRAAGLVRAR